MIENILKNAGKMIIEKVLTDVDPAYISVTDGVLDILENLIPDEE